MTTDQQAETAYGLEALKGRGVVVLLVLFLAAQVGIHVAPSQRAAAQLTRGDEYFLDEVYDEALPHYKEAAKLAPHDFRAFQRLGRVYQNLNQHQQSGEAYRQALEREPGHIETLVCYAEHQLIVKDFEGARATLKKVLAQQPICFEALDQMSRLEQTVGRPERAEFWCKKILEYRPHYFSAEYRLAQLALAAGRPQEALERVQHTFGIASPWDEMALELATVAHLRLGQPEQALQLLEHHRRRQVLTAQSMARVHFSVAAYYHQRGQARQATEQLEKGLKLMPSGPMAERARQMLGAP